MTLLKTSEAQRHAHVFRPSLPPASPPILSPAELEAQTLRVELELLRSERAEASHEIEKLKLEVDQAFVRGETEGRRAGLEEAQDREDDRGVCLAAGIERAIAGYETALASLERLAIEVGRTGLEKILGEPGHYPDLITRVVKAQISGLHAGSVLSVEVSSADFSTEGLSQFSQLQLGGKMAVDRKDDLQSGECRLRLTLGAVDIGVAQQWRCLNPLLSTMADAGTAP